MIKPEYWNDEKLGSEPESIQLTYIGTWTFSDDYGVVKGNPIWLKNQIFPYKQALRIETFSKWLEALEGQEMLIPFTLRGEKFYFIRTFRQHQSVEKPSKTRNCKEEELTGVLQSMGYRETDNGSWHKVSNHSGNSRGVVVDEEKRSISEEKLSTEPKGSPAGKPAMMSFDDEEKKVKLEFEKLQIPADQKEAWIFIRDWIEQKKPQFPDPYVVAWNIFSSFYNLPTVKAINQDRRKKIRVRLKEPGFDFFTILGIVRKSEFLKTSNWFGFDWIIKNDTNYNKILERPEGWN